MIIVIAIVLVVLAWFYIAPRRRGKLPPGPYPFPIIGNILQLGRNPHQSLSDLSKTYGPLISLQLGSVYTVVASSPEFAKLLLQENDQVFSSRTIPAAAEAHGHDKFSSGLIPVGERWRKGRKLFREHLFSTRRLEAGEGLRREKLRKLRDYVQQCGVRGRAVNLGEAAFVTLLNLLTVTLFSVDLADYESDGAQELRETIEGVTNILGAPNVADFFPFLKRFDPQGIKRKSEFYVGKLLAIIGDLIDQRLESRTKNDDLLGTLLDLMEGSDDYDLSRKDIQHLLLDLFLGGADTTQSTVEWAMTELVVNPEKMANAKNEVRSVIGKHKQVEESDIPRLPYLQAVIKETLRIHPPGPLLVPRRADCEVQISGYTIPQNAQILINVWAIGRDSSIWQNPNLFEPERFLHRKIDFKGQDFEFLPFGSGRRMCPGLPLADRMLHLMVASLIHNFDWKLEAGITPQEVDTTEKFGMALHKAVPLMVIPVKVKMLA
ncbi:hypothetical protein C2S51_037553 [Perilla frutescens var. frutescens]|nr:hypothetical protein C2S51_037553 [Perilla frutescens var. frutescens]